MRFWFAKLNRDYEQKMSCILKLQSAKVLQHLKNWTLLFLYMYPLPLQNHANCQLSCFLPEFYKYMLRIKWGFLKFINNESILEVGSLLVQMLLAVLCYLQCKTQCCSGYLVYKCCHWHSFTIAIHILAIHIQLYYSESHATL